MPGGIFGTVASSVDSLLQATLQELSRVNQSGTPRISGEQFLSLSTSLSELAKSGEWKEQPPPSNRRIHRWAIGLAVATVLSTFLAGLGAWVPADFVAQSQRLGTLLPVRQAILANWADGLQFSLGLMAILAAHELGHYLLTLVYRVPSTPPLFIPFPYVSPFGTMGAVIMMQSGTADRRQIFDIGLAGPLAGLVVAIPIIAYGLLNPHPVSYAPIESLRMGQPLLIQWMASVITPETAAQYVVVGNNQATPLLMAGWVGLLVTGINMMPLGQLDGGHVAFGLLGSRSIIIARAALLASLAFMIYMQVIVFGLMLVLVLLMGLRHPPSSDDTRSLGLARQLIGWLSLSLPILCVPANPLTVLQ
jgi:Zn-dependent protease